MIKSSLIRLLAHLTLILGTKYNGVQHKFYAFLLENIIRYRRNTVHSNLKKSFPHYSSPKIEATVHAYYHRLAFYLLQSIWAYFGDETSIMSKVVVKNPQVVKKYLDNNEKIIFLSAHYGNWEIISMLLPTYFTCPVIGIYKPLSSPTMEVDVKKWRSRFNLQLVPMKECINYFNAKNKNAFIALMVGDQSPPANESGIAINFLNQNTIFYAGTNTLKKRYNPKIFYQKISVIDDVHHIELIELTGEEVVQSYARLLEQDINTNPIPWLWSHNRWKHNH
jgi:Kdo2-lipid IVA lauroyltransferase/acyltransferase